jgi:WD40 repeat protein
MTLRLWDLRAAKHCAPSTAAAFVSGSGDKTLRLWDLEISSPLSHQGGDIGFRLPTTGVLKVNWLQSETAFLKGSYSCQCILDSDKKP